MKKVKNLFNNKTVQKSLSKLILAEHDDVDRGYDITKTIELMNKLQDFANSDLSKIILADDELDLWVECDDAISDTFIYLELVANPIKGAHVITKKNHATSEIDSLNAKLAEAEKRIAELEQYQNETVWRMTDVDFIMTKYGDSDRGLNGNYTEEDLELIEDAKENFSIDDWAEYVQIWIDCREDEKESKQTWMNPLLKGSPKLT